MSTEGCCVCRRLPDRTLNERGKYTVELRPYGPGGAPICVECAFATPKQRAATAAAFGALLEANRAISPSGIVAITDEWLRPFDPSEAAS